MRRPTLIAFAFLASLASAQERVRDVIYAKRGGVALTMDVFRPAKPNRIGVIFVVSGGWVSSHEGINPAFAKPFTDRGITVFEVVHGSQPKYQIPEILPMIQRSVRFVRANAATYGIDPEKIGIFGGSAGGHLSLLTAGTSDEGNPDARDPVDHASDRINAVAAYFPPTDFASWGGPGLNPFDVPALRIFSPAFGVDLKTSREKMAEIGLAVSPIRFVTAKYPPTYLVHGDKDPVVPLQQSQSFLEALKRLNVPVTLTVVAGAGHDMGLALGPQGEAMADWFVKTLGK